MTFSYGELCPSCRQACSNADSRSTVKTTVPFTRVTSGRCPGCRLLKHVQVDVATGCWRWTAARYTQFGKPTYGQSSLHGQRTGAHRIAYMLWKGDVTPGLDVMHSCDIKDCVNPEHLSLGTRSQNLLDGFAAHPGVCAGENNGRARLTWPIVRAIRAASASGVQQPELAARHGVSQSHISQIVRGLKWPESQADEAVA